MTEGDAAAAGHSATIRTVVRGFGMNLFGGMTSAVLGFGFVLLITHAFSVSRVGVFFEAIAIFSTLIVVCQLGAGATIVKTVPEYIATGRIRDIKPGIGVALLPGAAFALAIAIALFLLAPTIAPVLVKEGNESDAVLYLQVLAPFIPLGSLMLVLLAATRGLGTMRPTVWLDSVFKPGFRFLLAGAAVLVSVSPAAFAGLWAAPVAIGFLGALIAVRRLMGGRAHHPEAGGSDVSATPQRALLKQFWVFTAPQWPAEVFQLAVLWIDIVLVGALVSSSAAGIYATVSRLVAVGAMGLIALVLVLGPVLSSMLTRGDLPGVRVLYRQVVVWLSAGSIPVFLVLATFAPVILQIFGDGYESGATILSILSLAMVIDVVAGPALLTLLMGGRSTLVLANTGAGFVVNIGLNVALIPPFGMTGAAIAWSASILLVNLLAVVQIGRIWKIQAFDSTFLLVSSAAVVCFGLGGLLSAHIGGQNLQTLLIAGALETLLYMAILWRLRARLALGALVAAVRARAA